MQDPEYGEVKTLPIESSEMTFEGFGISNLATAFAADPNMHNVRLDGSTLTYTLPDGTRARIVETVDNAGIRILDITEGTQTDRLTFDSARNEILLNGTPVKISMKKAYVFYQINGADSTGGAKTVWIFMGRSYPDIEVEQDIRTFSNSLLYSLMLVAFGDIVAGGQAAASACIQLAIDLGSPYYGVYGIRDMYHDPSYYGYKYKDILYPDSSFSTYVRTDTTEVWT